MLILLYWCYCKVIQKYGSHFKYVFPDNNISLSTNAWRSQCKPIHYQLWTREPGWSTPTAIANQYVSLINADWEAARDSLFLANSFRHSLEICELAYMGTQPACFVESGKSEGQRKGAGELDVANGISFPTQTLPRAWLSFLFQEIPCLLIKNIYFLLNLILETISQLNKLLE